MCVLGWLSSARTITSCPPSHAQCSTVNPVFVIIMLKIKNISTVLVARVHIAVMEELEHIGHPPSPALRNQHRLQHAAAGAVMGSQHIMMSSPRGVVASQRTEHGASAMLAGLNFLVAAGTVGQRGIRHAWLLDGTCE